MFSITSKSRYGITAILDLAENYGHGLVQIKEIVEKRSISKNYLEQIFNRLKKHGIIKSVRGNSGGYELASHPSEITLYTILIALEGDLEIVDPKDPTAVREIYEEVTECVKEKLSITIADILEKQQSFAQEYIFYNI